MEAIPSEEREASMEVSGPLQLQQKAVKR